jgi:copper resistance protein B
MNLSCLQLRRAAFAAALALGALAAAWADPMDDAMSAQGGTPPADARDPNAYADGLTLDRGPYALPGPRQLHLDDERVFATLLLDRLEAQRTPDDTRGAYDATLRVGRDNDRFVLKAEGEMSDGRLQDSRTEALWSRATHPFWDTQLGLRHDSGGGPSRNWLALGVQGIAPYWLDIDATAYVGEHGRSALRVAAEYELLATQRVILQPRVEANLYGKPDRERGLGSGLADLTAGLRVRYEIRRELAPYAGVEWSGLFGGTADAARAAGEATHATRVVAGLRLWY